MSFRGRKCRTEEEKKWRERRRRREEEIQIVRETGRVREKMTGRLRKSEGELKDRPRDVIEGEEDDKIKIDNTPR